MSLRCAKVVLRVSVSLQKGLSGFLDMVRDTSSIRQGAFNVSIRALQDTYNGLAFFWHVGALVNLGVAIWEIRRVNLRGYSNRIVGPCVV